MKYTVPQWLMNKLYNILLGYSKCLWAYEQWHTLMFPHISFEGEIYDDCDLNFWFFKFLNNYEGDDFVDTKNENKSS